MKNLEYSKYLCQCPKCGKFPDIRVDYVTSSCCNKVSIKCPHIFHGKKFGFEKIVLDTDSYVGIETAIFELCDTWNEFVKSYLKV